MFWWKFVFGGGCVWVLGGCVFEGGCEVAADTVYA